MISEIPIGEKEVSTITRCVLDYPTFLPSVSIRWGEKIGEEGEEINRRDTKYCQ